MTREEFLAKFPELIKSYQPSPKVLERIGGIEMLMIIGPTGVGKTTVIHELGLPFVLSDVTRLPRPNEVDGVDYYFRTDYDQIIDNIRAGDFVQTAVSPHGDFYATRASSYPVSGTGVMAIVADVIPIFRQLGFSRTISVFITPPSYPEWMRRLSSQSLSAQALPRRMAEAKRSFEFALHDGPTHFILNDEVGAAAAQIKNLLNGEVDQHREDEARAAAKQCLDQLKITFNL